jgi:multidrug efflux pump
MEFALALAGAVVVSGFVALTLTPMMCSQAAAPQPQAGPGSTAPWSAGSQPCPMATAACCAGSSRHAGALRRVTVVSAAVKGGVLQARWIVVGVMLASALAIWRW